MRTGRPKIHQAAPPTSDILGYQKWYRDNVKAKQSRAVVAKKRQHRQRHESPFGKYADWASDFICGTGHMTARI